jgi:hypothetical protein
MEVDKTRSLDELEKSLQAAFCFRKFNYEMSITVVMEI